MMNTQLRLIQGAIEDMLRDQGLVSPPQPALTPWYPPEIKPVREGWYLMAPDPANSTAWLSTRYWTGTKWTYNAVSEAEAPAFHWRGLTSPQE